MTLRQYLFLMIFTTVLTWFGFASVVKMIDPMSSGFLGFSFFYLSLTFAAIGTLAIAGVLIRTTFRKHEAPAKHVATSYRQSILLSVLIVGSLMIHSRGVLNWWTALTFIGTLTVAEFLLISYRS